MEVGRERGVGEEKESERLGERERERGEKGRTEEGSRGGRKNKG